METRRIPDSPPGIDVKSAIERIGGGVENYLRVLGKFAQNHADSIAGIRYALAKNDALSAQRLAHALAGVSGNLGADKLCGAARGLEIALRGDDREERERRLADTEERLAEALASIAALVPAAKNAGGKRGGNGPADLKKAAALARELQAAVDECDTGSKDLLAALKDEIGNGPFRAEVEAVERRIDKYDFDGAGAAVRKLAEALAAAE